MTRRYFIFALTLFATEPAFSEEPALQAQIDALKQQVESLQQQIDAQNAGSPSAVTASYDKKGFVLRTADGDNEFRVRGFLQMDGRWYADGAAVNTFTMRRVRVTFDGTVGKYYSYFVQPAFDSGAASLQDAYFDAAYADYFKLRFGRFKLPFGLERLQSSMNNSLVEAGFPTRLTPDYENGIQLFGTYCNGATDYQIAFVNGTSQENQDTDSDTNDNKEFAARIFTRPFQNTQNAGLAVLKGLGIGVAYAQGEAPTNAGAHPNYTAMPGLIIDNYSNVVFAPKDVKRFSPQGYWYYKQFGVLAEYVSTKQTLTRDTNTRAVNNTAWQALFSWVVTGESETYNAGITPNKPFLKDGGVGAVELVARYSVLNVDNANFVGTATTQFLNPDASVRRAANAGLSVNWYLAYNVKLQLNYDTFSYRGGAPNGGDRKDDHTFFTRVQLVF